jgi:hypothetical protein
MLGKAVDVPGQVNDVINKVGKYLQDTTPVKMADQKFEQLKAKVSEKFPKLDTQLTGLGTWMKENPAKSAAIIGLLTVLASLAGGPVGGAIAGTVLDVNGVKALAELPSLDQLRAKIIGLVNAPATKLAQLASAPAAKLARVFSAYAEKDAA